MAPGVIFFVILLQLSSAFIRLPVNRLTVVTKSTAHDDDEPSLRIGHGFDIHRLVEGNKLVIGNFSRGSYSALIYS
jgi:hypothetical protein